MRGVYQLPPLVYESLTTPGTDTPNDINVL